MPISSLSSLFETARASIAGERPVYGPDGKGGGVKIGYWKTPELADACKGKVYIYKDTPRPLSSPSLWYIIDDAGRPVFLDLYCASKGITVPWKNNPAYTVTTPIDRARAADPIGTAITDAAKDIPWYVWAGAGGLILLSVLRR